MHLVTFRLNGGERALAVEPRRTLLDTFRVDLSLTGAKKVCDMGDCGACTATWEGDRLTIWDSTQSIFDVRQEVATRLGLPEHHVRVIRQFMGGGESADVDCPYQALYRCPNVKTKQTPAYTNTGPAVAFRAPGYVEGAFALVGVAATLRLDGHCVAEARIVLSGVAPIPWRATAAEQVLRG
jgi:xanthine dehydrogenase iron-sulfur cluster and FAD-binding subunit A